MEESGKVMMPGWWMVFGNLEQAREARDAGARNNDWAMQYSDFELSEDD
jgi:hypothetical protein